MNLRHRLQRQTLVSALIVFAVLAALLFVWTIHDTRREVEATRSLIRQTVRQVLLAQEAAAPAVGAVNAVNAVSADDAAGAVNTAGATNATGAGVVAPLASETLRHVTLTVDLPAATGGAIPAQHTATSASGQPPPGAQVPASAQPPSGGAWIDRFVDTAPERLPVAARGATTGTAGGTATAADGGAAQGGAALIIRPNARSEFVEHLMFAGAAFAGLAVFGAVVAFTQYRTLMRAFAPVQTFKTRLEAFENGDLAARLPAPELDELAVIAQTFNRLADSLQGLIDEQRRLSQSLLSSRSEERQRLARELHDEMGQLVTALSVNVATSRQRASDPAATAANLALIERDVQTMRQVTRDLLDALRDPSVPDVLPAQTAAGLIALWQQRFGSVRFVVPGDLDEALQRLRHAEHQVARRVLQESLTNAFRHASPTQVVIATRGGAALQSLTIDNDGVVPSVNSPPGYGMTGMAERAAAIGARFAAHRLDAGRWRVTLEFAAP